jgi:Fe-S-cluster-containing dehydrogenase component
MTDGEFFIDPQRCIGCRACLAACMECGTHRGHSMIHLEFIERAGSVQTVPTICMHCDDPTCAEVCPADAIKKTPDGVVQSSLKPRCIGCQNCVLACPFGVPRYLTEMDQMMKCDMCYDRTSMGLAPMCATVCPSGALWYGKREDLLKLRNRQPLQTFVFGQERVKTKVSIMVPDRVEAFDVDVSRFLGRPKGDPMLDAIGDEA